MNQYYIDFLKKLKSAAKDKKETHKPARDVLRAIKKHYTSVDKLSTEYTEFLNSQNFWESYKTKTDLDAKFLYQEISIDMIKQVLPNPVLLDHYLCLMDIFITPDIQTEQVAELIKSLCNATEFDEKVNALENEELKEKLKHLFVLHGKQTKSGFDNVIKDIEDTSLGKLAKDIMSGLNIEDLQKSLNGGENILSSMQDSNSGLGKVISQVSQTMISKLASGEIQQDKLLQDAMSLATKLPGMMPGGMGNQMGAIGSLLQQFSGGAGGAGGEGGGNPMDMLSGLMKNMSGPQRNAAHSKMNSAQRRQKTAERLKRKMQKNNESTI